MGHSLPLSPPGVHILSTLCPHRPGPQLILDGQVTPSEPLRHRDICGTVGTGTFCSYPPDLNTGRPSADPWSMNRRPELRNRNKRSLMLLFEPLDTAIPEANLLSVSVQELILILGDKKSGLFLLHLKVPPPTLPSPWTLTHPGLCRTQQWPVHQCYSGSVQSPCRPWGLSAPEGVGLPDPQCFDCL